MACGSLRGRGRETVKTVREREKERERERERETTKEKGKTMTGEFRKRVTKPFPITPKLSCEINTNRTQNYTNNCLDSNQSRCSDKCLWSRQRGLTDQLTETSEGALLAQS